MTTCRIITVLFIFLFSSSIQAQSILWQETVVPMPEAGANGLETLLVWPDLPGKHPLALISHGSPRDQNKRPEMTAISYLPIAMEFARRGFAVAVVMRRGYGSSGGGWVEGTGSCNAPNYPRSAYASSRDLHAAIKYLGTLPQFDTDRHDCCWCISRWFCNCCTHCRFTAKRFGCCYQFCWRAWI